MSRSRTADNSSAVSLFPFLAVLICTMGSLLVVLIVVTRIERNQAKQRATAKAQSAPAANAAADESHRRLAEVLRRTEKFKAVRAQAAKQLEQEQLRLRQLEDHMRRLQDQLGAIMLASDELDAMSEAHRDDRAQARREIDRLHQLIAQARIDIETSKEELAGKKRSYAIVPYVGPNGTTRRPIYIECRGEEVILQPEGVRLTPQDFAPPFGPGNPLAATIRAAREHMVRQQSESDHRSDNEPYPLIIVRPSGIGGFHAVRRAVELANLEFGYQFVDGDWQLEFPAPDPVLANIEERALAIARTRQSVLAAAAPRVYSRRRDAYSVGSGPDALENLGGGLAGDSSAGPTEFSGLGDPGSLSNVVIGDEGDAVAGPLHLASASRGDVGQGPVDDAQSIAGASASEMSGAPGPGATATLPSGSTSDVEGSGRSAERQAAEGQLSLDASGARGPLPETGGPDTPPPNALTGNSSGPHAGDATTTGGPGGPSPIGSTTPTAAMSPGSRARGASSPTPSAGQSPMDEPSVSAVNEQVEPQSSSGGASQVVSNDRSDSDMGPSAYEPREYVEVRGHDWSFRDKNPEAVPLRRSVQIVVRQDRIAILPDANESSSFSRGGRVIEIHGTTAECLDEFGAALRSHVKGWGAAGRGLYWKPVLEFNIGPDGDERAAEFAKLLQDSGIELRGAATAAREQRGGDGATHSR